MTHSVIKSFCFTLALGSTALSKTEMLMPVTPTVSPDGKTIVFSWEDDLWMKSTDPADKSDAVRLTIHPARELNPTFSPDGKTIYYNSNKEGSFQVWSMLADSSGQPKQITFSSNSNLIEDISNDGSEVLYRSVRDFPGRIPYRLYTQKLGEKVPEQLVFNAHGKDGKLSPDGSKILFTREGVNPYRKGYKGTQASQIWLYDKTNDSFSEPVKDDMGCRSPIFMRDGSGFYYVSGKSGNFNLWKHEFNGSKNTQITEYKENSVMFPELSHDGSTLIFRKLFSFYKYDTATGKIDQIKLHHNLDINSKDKQDYTIKRTSDADFSPSGLEIVFASNGDLYAMDTVLREPKRLTYSKAYESNTFFGDKGKAVYHLFDDGVKTSINTLTKKDKSQFWWNATDLISTTLISSESTISSFTPSPDGKKIAYTTDDGKLYSFNLKSKVSQLIASSWSTPSFDWSPDSKWITYSLQDNNFNSDIFLAPLDGSVAPVNITKHPDNEFAPAFSPDGKKIAFMGRRRGTSYDLYYVDLTPSGSEKTSREKKLEAAKKVMKKDPIYNTPAAKLKKAINKLAPKKTPKTEPKKADPKKAPAKPDPAKPAPAKPVQPKPEAEKKELKKVEKKEVKTSLSESNYDLDDIQKRIVRLPMKGVTPTRYFWKHDSGSILVHSSSFGKATYALNITSKKAAKYIETSGSPIRIEKNGTIYWLTDGVPAVVKGGRSTKYTFSAQSEFSTSNYNRHIFRVIWRTMRDGFYDEHLNGKNWDAILARYEDAAAQTKSPESFDRIVSMLLGELNASHTGYTNNKKSLWQKKVPWSEEMRHLGLKYAQKVDGWHVNQVLPTGPTDKEVSRVKVGEIITAINGVAVNDTTIEYDVLWGQLKDNIKLKVKGIDGKERTVTIIGITYRMASALIAEAVIEDRKEQVEKLSNGKLGYIHISRMMWDEFEKFEQHLYENGAGKDGIVIDVRDNGGGFTTDHLLTALTQPRHAYTIPRNGGRGYPQDRFVYATWDKPIIVLCNQNSFSNAEIFAHAIRSLDRGQIVGVATAGGVISAGQSSILTAGKLRMPFRGWFVIGSGEDMELNGAEPHHTLWPQPGEMTAGIDKQIQKAVEVLTQEVKEENSKKKQLPPIYHNRK